MTMHLHYLLPMAAVITEKSTLTSRNQTTIPPAVRRALNLAPGDRVLYSIQPDGKVLIARAGTEENGDPVLDSFLQFLEQEMIARPHKIKPVPSSLTNRVRRLVRGVKVNLDSPLSEGE